MKTAIFYHHTYEGENPTCCSPSHASTNRRVLTFHMIFFLRLASSSICTVYVQLYSIEFVDLFVGKMPHAKTSEYAQMSFNCDSSKWPIDRQRFCATTNDHRWRFEFLHLETENRLYPQIQFSQSHERDATRANKIVWSTMCNVCTRLCVPPAHRSPLNLTWCWALLLSASTRPFHAPNHIFISFVAGPLRAQHFMAFHFAFFLLHFFFFLFRCCVPIASAHQPHRFYIWIRNRSIQSHLNRCDVNTAHSVTSERTRARIFWEFVSVVFAYVCCTFRHRFERHSRFANSSTHFKTENLSRKNRIQFRTFVVCARLCYLARALCDQRRKKTRVKTRWI